MTLQELIDAVINNEQNIFMERVTNKFVRNLSGQDLLQVVQIIIANNRMEMLDIILANPISDSALIVLKKKSNGVWDNIYDRALTHHVDRDVLPINYVI